MAFERTQMAWARTALSLISFGFALSNVFAALHAKDEGEPPFLTARAVGTLMIAIGLFSLAMGAYENRRAMNELRRECPGLPRSMATILSAVLAILGFAALASAYPAKREAPDALEAHPPVTLMCRAVAGRAARSIRKSWPLGLRKIASRMASISAESSLERRSGWRRSAESSLPRHI